MGPGGEAWTLETFTRGAETTAVWSRISAAQAVAYRLDPEYYQPEYLKLEATLASAEAQRVDDFAYVTDGIHASPDWVEDGGVRYLSAKCVKDNFFVLTDAGQISQEQNLQNMRTYLEKDDILLTTVGTIGNCAVVIDDVLPANIDRHVGLIRINHPDNVDPYFVATFLNSRYGRMQTLRESTGNVQLNLFIEKIKELLIPVGGPWTNEIGHMTRLAYERRKQSEVLYAEAETLLLDALGLDPALDAAVEVQRTYTQRASRVWSAGRLDAEYFHPEKWNLLDTLETLPGRSVSAYFTVVRDTVSASDAEPNEMVYCYDLTDAMRYFLDDDVPLIPAPEIGSTKKRFTHGDVVVSRLRSYLKEIAIVATPDEAQCVGSSEFIVLRPKSEAMSPDLLLVYLRSEPVQRVLKWCQSGSNHPRFKLKEITTLKLPDRILSVQDEVERLIQDGIASHREAHRLLEEAKHRVEAMILAEENS